MNYASILALFCFSLTLQACAQGTKNDKNKPSERDVGGRCEGCEAVHEYGNKILSWIDTLPDFNDTGKKLEISGTVFKPDGKTPASDVVVYIYHTDQQGRYPYKGGDSGWAKRHGYIRGWIKTTKDGQYKFYTLRPGAYPGGTDPEHIHIIIKEPGIKEYWIDDFLFDDDAILTARHRQQQHGRGGSGIVRPVYENGVWKIRRDVVLGRNIPGYN